MSKSTGHQVSKITRFFPASILKLPASFWCFAIYAAVAVFFTYPLIFHLSTSTYGYSGDNFGFMYYLWWWRYTRANNLDLHFSPLQEAPFGKIIYPETGNIAYFWPIKFLVLLTNEVAGYNLLLLLSFPLAGVAMYLLCREVLRFRSPRKHLGGEILLHQGFGGQVCRHPRGGGTRLYSARQVGEQAESTERGLYSDPGAELAAFIGGLIFAFCPYHLWKAYNHLDLCLIYVIPLFLWAWVRFERIPSPKRAVVLGLTAFLTAVTNYYYAFFTGLMALGLFVFTRLRKRKFPKELFKGYALAVIVAVVLSLPFTKTTLSGLRGSNPYGKSDIYDRPLENLLLLSARPWDYLIPSQDHPMFGQMVKTLHKKIETLSNDFKTQPGPPHERTIFLGYFTIFSALCSVYYAFRSRRHPEPRAKSRGEGYPQNRKGFFVANAPQNDGVFDFYLPLWFAILLLVLLSFPPFIYVKGIKIIFPTYFLHQIFPMFRSYSRLGLYVLALMIPLAVLSFDYLLQKFQKSAQKIAFTCAAGAFVLFEFMNFPPVKILDFSEVPSSYQWLADQKEEFIIAEYPKLFSLANGYMFQRIHLKPIFNPHGWSPYYQLWDWVEDLYSEEAINKLAALGVRYVLIHKKLLFPQENPVDELWFTRALTKPLEYDEIPGNLVLVEDFEETAIFEIKVDPEPIMGVIFEEENQLAISWSKDNWSWYGSQNKVYLMNLTDHEVVVRFSFEGVGGVDKLTFDGNALPVEKSDDVWKLFLQPGENVIEVISNVPYQFSRLPKIGF